MRRPTILLSLLILCCAAAPGAMSPAARPVMASAACPVEMSAEQARDGALSEAVQPGAAQRPVHAQQVIDLSLKNSRLARIVAAELEVHGTSAKGRTLNAQAVVLGDSPSNAVRRVHLAASVPANEQRTHRVSVDALTSVQWIDVLELRYADGSLWSAGPGRVCRVEPNAVLRVASSETH